MVSYSETIVDWETDDWPKECACGYEAESERDAVGHAVAEHPEVVLDG